MQAYKIDAQEASTEPGILSKVVAPAAPIGLAVGMALAPAAATAEAGNLKVRAGTVYQLETPQNTVTVKLPVRPVFTPEQNALVQEVNSALGDTHNNTVTKDALEFVAKHGGPDAWDADGVDKEAKQAAFKALGKYAGQKYTVGNPDLEEATAPTDQRTRYVHMTVVGAKAKGGEASRDATSVTYNRAAYDAARKAGVNVRDLEKPAKGKTVTVTFKDPAKPAEPVRQEPAGNYEFAANVADYLGRRMPQSGKGVLELSEKDLESAEKAGVIGADRIKPGKMRFATVKVEASDMEARDALDDVMDDDGVVTRLERELFQQAGGKLRNVPSDLGLTEEIPDQVSRSEAPDFYKRDGADGTRDHVADGNAFEYEDGVVVKVSPEAWTNIMAIAGVSQADEIMLTEEQINAAKKAGILSGRPSK